MSGGPSKSRGALEVILFEEARFRGSMMFTSNEVTVGSDPGVMIRLDDSSVSACHAVLRFDGDVCTVANYDEFVGTQVNGEPIEEQVVSATDEIRIAQFRLRITVHRADATPAPLSVRPPARPVASPSRAGSAKAAPAPSEPRQAPAPAASDLPAPAKPAVASAASGSAKPTTTAPRAPSVSVKPAAMAPSAPAKPAVAIASRESAKPAPSASAPASAKEIPEPLAPVAKPNRASSARAPAPSAPAPTKAAPAAPAPRASAASAPALAVSASDPSALDPPPAPPVQRISKPMLAVVPAPQPTSKRAGTADLTSPSSGGHLSSTLAAVPAPATVRHSQTSAKAAPSPQPSQAHGTMAGLPTLSEEFLSNEANATMVDLPTMNEATAAAYLAAAKTVRTDQERPLPSVEARPLPSVEEVDEDDLEDALYQPSFSLLAGLLEVGTAAAASKNHAVQVVRFRHDCVLKLRHLRHGEKLRLPGLHKPVGHGLARGGFVFHRDVLPEGITVKGNGQILDHQSWRTGADGHGQIALAPATQVIFPLPTGDNILVQLVPQVAPLGKAARGPWLTKFMMAVAGASVAAHLLVFAIIGLTSLVRRDFIADNKDGRFARIALKEIELEPPAPPPKAEKEKKKPKPEPSPTASSEAAPKVAGPRLPRTRPSTPQAQASATAQKLLSALGGLSNGPSKPMSATAMSNLDAVGPIRGGGFKVSGAIGKLPGDSLRLAAAGSGIGRLDTKSSSEVGKNLGKVLGKGPSGLVRAQVTAKPNAMKVEGHLDRGEIQKVINAHIFELQGCFERQLISNPNLAGKVTFEWVIGLNGGVTTVRIKASSLSSNDATSCMQAAIRRWQFPSPHGGQVTVVYPIALANSGS